MSFGLMLCNYKEILDSCFVPRNDGRQDRHFLLFDFLIPIRNDGLRASSLRA